MAIKSIVEMKAKPGRRDELLSTLQQMSAVDAPGFIAAEHYRNVEDEDTVIGIYDWKSNEERVAWSQSLDPGTREQLLEVLATPCASFWLITLNRHDGTSAAPTLNRGPALLQRGRDHRHPLIRSSALALRNPSGSDLVELDRRPRSIERLPEAAGSRRTERLLVGLAAPNSDDNPAENAVRKEGLDIVLERHHQARMAVPPLDAKRHRPFDHSGAGVCVRLLAVPYDPSDDPSPLAHHFAAAGIVCLLAVLNAALLDRFSHLPVPVVSRFGETQGSHADVFGWRNKCILTAA